MKTYINWNQHAGVTANTYMGPASYNNSDVLDFIDDILSGHADSHYSGDLTDAMSVLEDGAALAELVSKHDEDEVQRIVEDVHSVIREAIAQAE